MAPMGTNVHGGRDGPAVQADARGQTPGSTKKADLGGGMLPRGPSLRPVEPSTDHPYDDEGGLSPAFVVGVWGDLGGGTPPRGPPTQH